MNVRAKKRPIILVCYMFTALVLASCRNPEELPDYVSLVKEECLLKDMDAKIKLVAPPSCRQALERIVPFDDSFDQLAKSHGDQKGRVINALYFLLNNPTDVPLSHLMFGHVPAELFFPDTMKRWMSEYPDVPLHHLLFNNILHSFRVVRLADVGITKTLGIFDRVHFGAYYIDIDQSVNIRTYKPSYDMDDILNDARMLIHEARHTAIFDHVVYCPELSKGKNECDLGMDQPHGFEAAYLWALLRGSHHMLPKYQVMVIAENFFNEMQYIYGLPKEVAPLKQDVALWFGYNKLSTSVSLSTYSDYSRLTELEQLPFYPEGDFYTQMMEQCPYNPAGPSTTCLDALSALTHTDAFAPSPTRSYLLHVLYMILHHPLSAKELFLGRAPVEKLFVDNRNIMVYPLLLFGRNMNQYAFQMIVQHIRDDFSFWESFSEYLPLPVDPNYPLSPMGRVWFDVVQNLFAQAVYPDSTFDYQEDSIDQGNRLIVVLLWSLLKGQLQLPKSDRTLTDTDLDTLTKLLCIKTQRLNIMHSPSLFQDLSSMSCGDLRALL